MAEPTLFLDGRVKVYGGDCVDVIKQLPDNSIDAVCTDPPYALVSIGKRFAAEGAKLPNGSDPNANPYNRVARGFMQKAWDNGSTAFSVDFWREVWRVLKPGAFVLAMGGDRSVHRLATAIEDAGFEIRGQLAYLYGTGFPKSLHGPLFGPTMRAAE